MQLYCPIIIFLRTFLRLVHRLIHYCHQLILLDPSANPLLPFLSSNEDPSLLCLIRFLDDRTIRISQIRCPNTPPGILYFRSLRQIKNSSSNVLILFHFLSYNFNSICENILPISAFQSCITLFLSCFFLNNYPKFFDSQFPSVTYTI